MFVGKDSAGKLIGVGKVSTEKPHPMSLATEEDDIKSKDIRKAIQLIDLKTKIPYILVIKKNSGILSGVAEIFSAYKERISEHAMLLIDDESDYGSIDTNKPYEEEPSAINKRIRGLLNCFKKYSYIAYTATPFANIFIDFKLEKGKLPDLFPKNFIHFLEPPSNYCGLQKVFEESPEKFLVDISDHGSAFPIEHGKDHKVPYLPESLLEAIHVFCLNIAIRHLRKQKEHNSMLVNVTRFNNVQDQVFRLLKEYLEVLKKEVGLITEMKIIFNRKFKDVNFSWEKVQKVLLDTVVPSVSAKLINQKSKEGLDYKQNTLNVIVVGGLRLSRGLTLEGLSVSYFIRGLHDSEKKQKKVTADTLMQMARWFGYRRDYEDLCKIYMPKEIQDIFEKITEVTNKLMEQLREMRDEELTPLDVALEIQHFSELLPTARNKMENAVLSRGDDRKISLSNFSKDEQIHKENLILLFNFIKSLGENGTRRTGEGRPISWKYIEKEKVLDFIEKFKVFRGPKKKAILRLKGEKYSWCIVHLFTSGKGDFVGDELKVKGAKTGIQVRAMVRGAEIHDDHVKLGYRKITSGNVSKNDIDEGVPVLTLYVLDLNGKNKDKTESLLLKGVPMYDLYLPGEGKGRVWINQAFQDGDD
ncbi:Z1 domain-containing protein [Helicobacter suis]|uniref:Z1 domain-containing protein n=1 Tax=Helicobacter suis TaxID=104628 RepID=UPI0013D2396C|nr:Z1 domain-containing protein [Helicobacter suis]